MQLGQSMLFYQQNLNNNQTSVIKKISNYVFRFDQKIGQGNFSKVYRGQHQLTNQAVAIKIIQLSSIKSQKLQELLFSEIEVIQSLNHPNILKCHEVLRSDHNCYIITELCNGGDLQSVLKNSQFMNQQTAIPYIRNIYQGLLYLGERGIVHRDLKSANIFLHNGVAKIADFGFARYTNNQTFKDMDIGSPLYMSPEGMIDNIYGMKTDIWSFGIIIYELLHGCNPYGKCQNEYQLKHAVVLPLHNNSFRPDISWDIINLIKKCLQINYQARPNAQALLSDNFIGLMLNNGQGQAVHSQKKIQWADQIIQTNYIEAPQHQHQHTRKLTHTHTHPYPSSQQKIYVQNNDDNLSRYINRSYGMIPNGDAKTILPSQNYAHNNIVNSKQSPTRFLNIPQSQKQRQLSPNNSDSNINYRSNNPQQNFVKPNYIKSNQITPNRKEQLNVTSIVMSSEAKRKHQLSGSHRSSDSWTPYNPIKNGANNINGLIVPRGSYKEEINRNSTINMNNKSNNMPNNYNSHNPQKNLQFLVNQNRLQLQKKEQMFNKSNQKPTSSMVNSLPGNKINTNTITKPSHQFSSEKKFGQIIKGQKKNINIQQCSSSGSNFNINSIKNVNINQTDQKLIKSKSYMMDKSVNSSIYTSSNNTSIINPTNSSLKSPRKNYNYDSTHSQQSEQINQNANNAYSQSNTSSNFFTRQKQSKSTISNNNINNSINKILDNHLLTGDIKQKNNLISTVIQFKEAVGLLHYCRLLFRFITTLRKIKLMLSEQQAKSMIKMKNFSTLVDDSEEEILSKYLITVLDQLLKKIKLKGIIYQGDSYKKKQLKQTKLIEVAEEYFRKYVKEINKHRKGKQIIATYDLSTSLQFFKNFAGQMLFNVQKQKAKLQESLTFNKGFGQNTKYGQIKTEITNMCYLGIRLCESTQVIERCFSHKNYVQLAKLTIQNWLAHENYSQKQYKTCLQQREKAIKMSMIKGSQTNDTQQNNRHNDIQ